MLVSYQRAQIELPHVNVNPFELDAVIAAMKSTEKAPPVGILVGYPTSKKAPKPSKSSSKTLNSADGRLGPMVSTSSRQQAPSVSLVQETTSGQYGAYHPARDSPEDLCMRSQKLIDNHKRRQNVHPDYHTAEVPKRELPATMESMESPCSSMQGKEEQEASDDEQYMARKQKEKKKLWKNKKQRRWDEACIARSQKRRQEKLVPPEMGACNKKGSYRTVIPSKPKNALPRPVPTIRKVLARSVDVSSDDDTDRHDQRSSQSPSKSETIAPKKMRRPEKRPRPRSSIPNTSSAYKRCASVVADGMT